MSQTAPAISGWTYALTGVAVTKGSTAWAVGGSGEFPQGDTAGPDNSNGIILSTTNGGFSWTQAVRRAARVSGCRLCTVCGDAWGGQPPLEIHHGGGHCAVHGCRPVCIQVC